MDNPCSSSSSCSVVLVKSLNDLPPNINITSSSFSQHKVLFVTRTNIPKKKQFPVCNHCSLMLTLFCSKAITSCFIFP